MAAMFGARALSLGVAVTGMMLVFSGLAPANAAAPTAGRPTVAGHVKVTSTPQHVAGPRVKIEGAAQGEAGVAYVQVGADITPTSLASPHNVVCYTGNVWRKDFNSLGNLLWKFQLDANWCVNWDTQQVSSNSNPGFEGESHFGWSYDGVLSWYNHFSGGESTDYGQGKISFPYIPGSTTCYPKLWFNMFGTGETSWNTDVNDHATCG